MTRGERGEGSWGKEGRGASKGTQIEDSRTRTKVGRLTVGVEQGWGRGEQQGKRRDNCN